MNRKAVLFPIGYLSVLLAMGFTAPTTQSTIGSKIVAYCKQHLNQQVGDGECAALAGFALRDSGAQDHSKRADNPNKDDYVWGELVLVVTATDAAPKYESGNIKDIRPGDIIQIRDVKFEHKDGKRYSSITFDHHTAVVVKIDLTSIYILHQNFGGKRFVTPLTLNLRDLKTGWLRFYHPQPKED